MISLLYRPGKYTWQQKLKFFAEHNRYDLPNYFALDKQLTTWEYYWESFEGDRPDTISKTLKVISFVGFEIIKVALIILAALTVTCCECERSFSAIRRLKNYNRSTMAEDRFDGLALMHIHQEFNPSIEHIIDKFAATNRRLDIS